MNNFSNEQSEVLMNHVEFLMNTDQFDFMVYFLTPSSLLSEHLGTFSDYQFSINKEYRNFIRFKSFDQIKNYINKYFSSATEFCNQFFAVMPGENLDEHNNVFINSIPYLEEQFPNKLDSFFKSGLEEIFSNQHILIFNFVFKNYNPAINLLHNSGDKPYKHKFYNENLTEVEHEYFKNQYIYHYCFDTAKACQNEPRLSNELSNYRAGFTSFNMIYEMINKYEHAIKNYMLPKLEEYNICMYGKNNQYTNALKKFITDFINKMSSKKIQFDICNTVTSEPYQIDYTSNTFSTYNRESEKRNIKMLLDTMPDKTEKMLSAYFICKLKFKFKEPLSMQVKKTFMSNFRTYSVNNKIQPTYFKLIDDDKITKPAEGFMLNFICNMYEDIGINPITFMIPKLGMKKF